MIKMKSIRILSTIAIIAVVCTTSGAQVLNEINNKLDIYLKKYPEEKVYLQSDRSAYSPAETIWFKAWLLNDTEAQQNELSNYLYISLIDKDSIEIISQVLPLGSNQLDGSLKLPELLNPGYYKLIAYTTWMKNTPVDRIFDKNILIRNSDNNEIDVDLKLSPDIAIPSGQAFVMIRTAKKDGSAVSVNYNYRLFNNKGVLSSGKGKTGDTGESKVSVGIPDSEMCEGLKMEVDVSYKSFRRTFAMAIPWPGNSFNIMFYPESGLMLYGIDTKVAFRAFNQADRPVDFKGEIYTNDNVRVKQVESTYQGIGSFNLTPEKGKTYYLKVTQPEGISQTFNLPVPRRTGLALHVESVTEDALTLVAQQTSRFRNTYNLIGQSNGNIYWMDTINTSGTAIIKVPLKEFPAGVSEFTVFDSAKNLMAKRLVFINQQDRLNITLKPDKTVYAPREKVSITISVTDDKGKPVDAWLALGAVLSGSDININNPGLYSYSTLKSNLIGFLPTPDYYLTKEHNDILDDLLIANAFKRFTWGMVLGVNQNSIPFKSMEENGNPVPSIEYDRNLSRYFAQDIHNSLNNPGNTFTKEAKNDMDRILNPENYKKAPGPDYSKMKDVDEIVYSIKPYKLIDGKIVFHSSSPNTLMNQQGAAIAIDGVYRGTDPTIFSTLKPTDIDRVVVSTNPIDVQKYTGLNTIGIIEIFTKTGRTMLTNEEEKAPRIEKVKVNDQFTAPDYEAAPKSIRAGTDRRETLYWNAGIRTGRSGTVTITFFNGDATSEVKVTAEGMSTSATPLTGTGSTTYTIRRLK